MPEYRIAIAKKALRELTALPIEIQDRVIRTIDRLAMNPLPAGSKKLRGALRAYRVRVEDYRVIYEIGD